MRTLVLIFLFIASMASEAKADQWTRTNTALHIPLTLLFLQDLNSTSSLADDGWEGAKENNIILGPKPTKKAVEEYFALTYITSTAVAYKLDEKSSYLLQSTIIAVQVYALKGDLRFMYRFEF